MSANPNAARAAELWLHLAGRGRTSSIDAITAALDEAEARGRRLALEALSTLPLGETFSPSEIERRLLGDTPSPAAQPEGERP